MAKFLNTTGIIATIDTIVREADSRVTLISPYIDISPLLLQSLQIADNQKTEIVIVYGKKKRLGKEILANLGRLKNLSIYFLENLHAKCYFNERLLVITSLNLYDYSERHNVEMGISLSAINDPALFKKAKIEASRIVDLAQRRLKIPRIKQSSVQNRFESTEIPIATTSADSKQVSISPNDSPMDNFLDLSKSPVLKSVKGFLGIPDPKNNNPKEGFCQKCGKPSDKPLCKSCWSLERRSKTRKRKLT